MNDKRNVSILIIMLIIFSIIFFVSFVGMQKQEVLFGLGIPPIFENWLIMFLSLGSIVRIVWELYKK
jgi:hypothetical protein